MSKYPYSDTTWPRVLEKIEFKLNEIAGIHVTESVFLNESAPYIIYSDGSGYSSPGYQLITITYIGPAVMDCRISPSHDIKHKLTDYTSVKIDGIHQIEIYIPRTYNDQPIGWGIRFASEPPMYPNILCATMQGVVAMRKFSQTRGMTGGRAGMICIGAAQDSQNPVEPHVLISDLKNYLSFSDPARWKHKGEVGGVNDYGFEQELFEHMAMNYEILKKAYAAFSQPTTNEQPKRRRLGGSTNKPERRRLGDKR